jgi:hypothetical protein
MHTGWGPRYQMTLVDSVYETRSSAELEETFQYPAVAAANPDEFYALQGDMIDYVYTLRDKEFPQVRLYATAFEYGTYGETVLDQIRCLRTMILENQAFHYGASENAGRQARRDFRELFAPTAEDWKRKAVADADQAFEGILRAEGFFN